MWNPRASTQENNMQKGKSFLDKERMYWEYREDTNLVVAQEISVETSQDVRLTDINVEALHQVSIWRSQYYGALKNRTPGWDWVKEVAKFRRRPRRVELAIWSGANLCGLVIGRVSDRRVVASIHLLESNPGQNPLKGNIAAIAIRWLSTFAFTISCKEISIERPVPELIEFYRELGFSNEITRGKKIVRLKNRINR